ncbi:MAG: glycosyltransferase family 4 protein [Candidatus Taylorbacteria bacterium]|nr:glycosyltransferase family 4 protein [Candidatus Taylorbacteria bacterium]
MHFDINFYFDGKIKEQDTIISLPGRVVQRKGFIEALEALSKIKKKRNCKLIITGMARPYDKRFANQILKLAKKLGIQKNLLIPSKLILRRHLPLILKRSNIVITPSYYEGLGLTAIEALAVGRPLILTNVPGLNEIGVHEKNCLMIPPQNSDALGHAILKLLNNKPLAEYLAKNGTKSIKIFNNKKFTHKLEKVYKNLIR